MGSVLPELPGFFVNTFWICLFGVTLEGTEGKRELVFDRCALREVCTLRGVQAGGALCKLFHAYFDGILNELICRPVKSELVATGDSCRATVSTQ